MFRLSSTGVRSRPISPLAADIGAVLLVMLGVLAIYALRGFPTLADANGDNDSLLRLVEVRDLIAGQGWFDLHQYRMGPPGGFVMHWSRLVDVPIALILLAAQACGAGTESAATIAGLLWPLSLNAVALFLILRTVRTLVGERALLPAAVIAGAALYATGVFLPANFDHHNVQLVLALAMLACMTGKRQGLRAGSAAGVCAALMLAVGMETLPFVAAGGLVVALRLAVFGDEEKASAAGFGIGLAVASAAVMALTIRPSEWFLVHCDAFSFAQFAAAAISGSGLAVIALLPTANRDLPRRMAALVLLAAMLAVAALSLFPQCIGSPYAALDPELRRLWLDHVGEAQPFSWIVSHDLTLAFASYATPVLALAVLAGTAWRGRLSRRWLAVALLLLTAVLVSMWQVRGAKFALPIASIVLSGWVAHRRGIAAGTASRADELKTVGAWLISISLFWTFSAASITTALEAVGAAQPSPAATAAIAQSECYRGDDYGALAKLPAGTVLASSNLGASILRFTHHRVFAGPYHRNQIGMRIALDAFMAGPVQAESVAAANDVDYIVVCPGNDETGFLARHAPQGLMAALVEGHVPAWMTPIADGPETALRIYRVTAR